MERSWRLCYFVEAHQRWSVATVIGGVASVRVDQSGKGMIYFASPVSGAIPGCTSPYYTNVLERDRSFRPNVTDDSDRFSPSSIAQFGKVPAPVGT